MIRTAFGEVVATVLLTRIDVFDPSHRLLLATSRRMPGSTPAAVRTARLERFRDCCLPSFANLDPKPDAWLLLADEHTAEDLIRTYRELVAGRGEILPLKRVPELWHWEPRYYTRQLKELIAARVSPAATHIATFGLDDDDALRFDYFGAVTAYLIHHRNSPLGDGCVVVNTPYGYVDTGKYLTVRSVPANMFAGLIEPRSRFDSPGDEGATIYKVPHPALPEAGDVVDLAVRKPAWLKVSHFTNLAMRNDFAAELDGIPVLVSSAELRQFGIERPQDPSEGRRVAAAHLRRSGSYEEAQAIIAAAVASGGQPAAFHEAALIAACRGLAETSLELQARALALDDRWIVSDFWLIRALLIGRSYQVAHEIERRLRPHASTTRHELDVDAALLEEAAARCPSWAWPLLHLARWLAARGELEGATQLLDEATGREPQWPPAWTELGQVLLRGDNPDEALRAFSTSVALESREPTALLGLGYCHRHAKQWRAAIEAFEGGLRNWVEGAPPERVFFELALCYFHEGRVAAGEATLRHGAAIYKRSNRLQAPASIDAS